MKGSWVEPKLGPFQHLQLPFSFSPVFCHSVSSQENHIELSFLPEDTGKLSVLPKSLGLPLHETKQEKKGEELKKLKAKRRRRDSESEQVATSA